MQTYGDCVAAPGDGVADSGGNKILTAITERAMVAMKRINPITPRIADGLATSLLYFWKRMGPKSA